MVLVPFLVTACLVVGTIGAPSSNYVVHQRRDLSKAAQWIQQNVALNKTANIPIKIALQQQNLDQGEKYLMDVSDPTSANFGKHWTADKVAQTFGASNDSITAVNSWLTSAGIAGDRMVLSQGRNWIHVNLTVAEAESILKTQYNVYQHLGTSKDSLACEEYSVPANIQQHIDFIRPTIAYAPMTKIHHDGKNSIAAYRRSISKPADPPTRRSSHKQTRDSGIDPLSWDISKCGSGITRACAQALYNIPNNTLTASSYGIVEYSNEIYVQSDLEKYMYNLVTTTNTRFTPAIYIMPDAVFTPISSADTGEGNLDIQIAAGLTYPQPLTYYQLGSDASFFDAIDTTNCPTCGGTPLTSVISTSWGSEESLSSSDIAVEQRTCNEYMKLGLMGTTMIFSSGDNGVAGNGGTCKEFIPTFPSVCPYITSVGATKIATNGTIHDREEAVEYFASGGGFSNLFPMPTYQSKALSQFFSQHNPTLSSSLYNSSQNARGFPDISANGDGYKLIMNGTWENIGGTSASAPIIGSIISLINEERIKNGKGTVGFINPVLYANTQVLNDVVKGSNPGCGSVGFQAGSGWDPVTGLGTLDYKRLLDVYLALP